MNRKHVSRLSEAPNPPMGSEDLTLGRGHRQDYRAGPSVLCSGKVEWTDPGFRRRGRASDGVLLQRIPPTIVTDTGREISVAQGWSMRQQERSEN